MLAQSVLAAPRLQKVHDKAKFGSNSLLHVRNSQGRWTVTAIHFLVDREEELPSSTASQELQPQMAKLHIVCMSPFPGTVPNWHSTITINANSALSFSKQGGHIPTSYQVLSKQILKLHNNLFKRTPQPGQNHAKVNLGVETIHFQPQEHLLALFHSLAWM